MTAEQAKTLRHVIAFVDEHGYVTVPLDDIARVAAIPLTVAQVVDLLELFQDHHPDRHPVPGVTCDLARQLPLRVVAHQELHVVTAAAQRGRLVL